MAMQEKLSTEFLPPVSCNFKELKGDELEREHENRERIVCATGLDVHFKMNIYDTTNPDEPVRVVVNPRQNSPAVDPEYLGKTYDLSEELDPTLLNDCMERSKRIATKKPYYEALYKKYDPRRHSNTVIMRDYVCKVPMEITNLDKLAGAVLDELPNQYASFLKTFVDYLFGATMKEFLTSTAERYMNILSDKDMMNRMGWTFYYNIASNNKDVTLDLKPDDKIIPHISGMASVPNSELLSCKDVADIEPCIRQHMETLKMMYDGCKGFATTEFHARLMLEYANMQGRNLCDDLTLTHEGHGIDYDKITLKVPTNFFLSARADNKAKSKMSMTGETYGDLKSKDEELSKIQMVDLPVGQWGGPMRNTGVTLNADSSQYIWGWGHPANLFQVRATVGGGGVMIPSHLPFVLTNPGGGGLEHTVAAVTRQLSTGYINRKKWGNSLWSSDNVVEESGSMSKTKTLNDILSSRTETFRNAISIPANVVPTVAAANRQVPSTTPTLPYITTPVTPCDKSGKLVHVPVFNVTGQPMAMGEKCIRFTPNGLMVPASYFLSGTVFKSGTDMTSSLVRLGFEQQKLLNLVTPNLRVPPGAVDKTVGPGGALDPSLLRNPYRGTIITHTQSILDDTPIKDTDKTFNDFINVLNGIPDYSRNIYLVPTLYAGRQQFDTDDKSMWSRFMFKLKNPELLKSDSHFSVSLKIMNERDRLILQINLIRNLLQYSYGMHTAAFVFEELLPDSVMLLLAHLDAIRRYPVNTNLTSPLTANASINRLNIKHETDWAALAGVPPYCNPPGVATPTTQPMVTWLNNNADKIDVCVLHAMMTTIRQRLQALFDFTDKEGKTEHAKFLRKYGQLWQRHDFRVRARQGGNGKAILRNNQGKVVDSVTRVQVLAANQNMSRRFGASPVFMTKLFATDDLVSRSIEGIKYEMESDATLDTYRYNRKLASQRFEDTSQAPAVNVNPGNQDAVFLEEAYEDTTNGYVVPPVAGAVPNSTSLGALRFGYPDEVKLGSDPTKQPHEELIAYADCRAYYTSDFKSYLYQIGGGESKNDSVLVKAIANMNECKMVKQVLGELHDGLDKPAYTMIEEIVKDYGYCMRRTDKAAKHQKGCFRGSSTPMYRGAVPPPTDESPITVDQLTLNNMPAGFNSDYPVGPTPLALAGGAYLSSTSIQDRYLLTTSGAYDIQRFPNIDFNDHIANQAFRPPAFGAGPPTLGDQRAADMKKTSGMLFSMLDAAGFAWVHRRYSTPGDTDRPENTRNGNQDNMHYWSRILTESFVSSREQYVTTSKSTMCWEAATRLYPGRAFPASQIGSLCERTWREQFPLLAPNHKLREKLAKVRSLSVMWYELPKYTASDFIKGAWVPLPPSMHHDLLRKQGLFDDTLGIPMNPWNLRNQSGLFEVFCQSYHSPYTTTPDSAHLHDWLKTAVPYQLPDVNSHRPFTKYGGTPVSADFVHHLVEAPKNLEGNLLKLYERFLHSRFGTTTPLRVGNALEDTGLLQDMFSFSFGASSKASKDDKAHASKTTPACVRISNFLSYARNHAIMALASSNAGTEEMSEAMFIRNYFRLYVDTYKCAGVEKDSDNVPFIIGMSRKNVHNLKAGETAVTFYAATMNCINAQMNKFVNSKQGNEMYLFKQLYLNDATLLFERYLRSIREENLYWKNYTIAKTKNPSITPLQFADHVRKIDKEHISFLQNTIIGMLYQMGYEDEKIPLNLLESRELYVDPSVSQNTDLIGMDFLSPAMKDAVANTDYDTETMDLNQMAQLSMIPPNKRFIGMYYLDKTPSNYNTNFLKKQLAVQAEKKNKVAWRDYARSVLASNYGSMWLGQSIDTPAFDMEQFSDPRKEVAKLAKEAGLGVKFTTNQYTDSSASLTKKSGVLRSNPSTVAKRLSEDDKAALRMYDAQVRAMGGDKFEALSKLNIPEPVSKYYKRILAKKYASEN